MVTILLPFFSRYRINSGMSQRRVSIGSPKEPTSHSQFHLAPRGKNIVTVCAGTVCHVKGAPRIISKIQEDLKLKEDQDTTRDKQFTLERVNCVGACSIAPVVLVNNKVLGKVTPISMVKSLKEYKE